MQFFPSVVRSFREQSVPRTFERVAPEAIPGTNTRATTSARLIRVDQFLSMPLQFRGVSPWVPGPGVANRYTWRAVPENIDVRSDGEKPTVSFLNAFHNTRYDSDIRSTGKFDSNIARSGPKASMVCGSSELARRGTRLRSVAAWRCASRSRCRAWPVRRASRQRSRTSPVP